MSKDKSTFEEQYLAFFQDAIDFMNECKLRSFLTTDKDLQKRLCDEIQIYASHCLELKNVAITESDEIAANGLLGLEFLLRAIFNELSMWVALKDDKSEQAWDALVAAQSFIRCTMKATPSTTGMEEWARRLNDIERVVFPRQTFTSAGLIIEGFLCSICEKKYGDCGHVVGRPYMGQLCSKKATGIKNLDHVAIIIDKEPRDKRCRVTSIEDEEGNQRDTLNWRIVPSNAEDNGPDSKDGHHRRMTFNSLYLNGEPGV